MKNVLKIVFLGKKKIHFYNHIDALETFRKINIKLGNSEGRRNN